MIIRDWLRHFRSTVFQRWNSKRHRIRGRRRFSTNPIPAHIQLLESRLMLAATPILVSHASGQPKAPGNDNSGVGSFNSISTSADGRYVAFESDASNLVANDTNHFTDIFVYDKQAGTIQRVSVGSNNAQANGDSFDVQISADGRYVAYTSDATNLVNDGNHDSDVFLYDRQLKTTTRISVGPNGRQSDGNSGLNSISGDGRYITFASDATNLLSTPTNGSTNVYVYDRQLKKTTLIAANASSSSQSSSGRMVAYMSDVDSNVYVIDRSLTIPTPVLVSADNSGVAVGAFGTPSISADGTTIVFTSGMDFDPKDSNGSFDVFVRHLGTTPTTELVSVNSAGMASGTGNSVFNGSQVVSSDGRFVVFSSDAADLVNNDTNGVFDVFVRDMTGTTSRVSVNSTGIESSDSSALGTISSNGRFVSFASLGANLIPTDSNNANDVFEVANPFGGSTPPGTTSPPIITINAPPVQYTIGTPVQISPTGSVTNTHAANFGGGYLQVTLTNAQAGDVLDLLTSQFNSGSGVERSGSTGSTISYNGVNVGTLSGGNNGTPLKIALNSSATADAVTALLDAVIFQTSNNPSTVVRSVQIVVSDGKAGGVSDPALTTIEIHGNPIVGSQTLDGIADLKYQASRRPATLAIAPSAVVTDPSAVGFTRLRIDLSNANGGLGDPNDRIRIEQTGSIKVTTTRTTMGTITQVTYMGVVIGKVTSNLGGAEGSQFLQIDFNSNATAAAVQALLRSLTFRSVAPTSTLPAGFPRKVEYTMTDGAGQNVVVDQQILMV